MPMRAGVSNVIAGQCHRYTPYDTRPRPRNGGRSSANRTGPGNVVATAASAVPIATSAKPPRYRTPGASVTIAASTPTSATPPTTRTTCRPRRVQVRRDERGERAEEERLRARVGAVVDARHARCRCRRGIAIHAAEPTAAIAVSAITGARRPPARTRAAPSEQQRPAQVELLLDRERPQVHER